MKTLTYIIVVLAGLSLTSCIIVTDTPGPAGRPGNAYFGVSYDVYEPYSYWDNNPDIPNDPYLDEYYPTVPGLYEFEYYVNRVDYWYGTYEIWVNAGEPGRPGGRPGRDGLDTYLMLVCNPDGPYEARKSAGTGNTVTTTALPDGSLQYIITNADGGMKVTMKKTTSTERPSQTPKVFFKK